MLTRLRSTTLYYSDHKPSTRTPCVPPSYNGATHRLLLGRPPRRRRRCCPVRARARPVCVGTHAASMLWRRANPSRPSRPSRRRAHAVANGKGQPAPPHRPRVVGVAFTHANKHFASRRADTHLSHTHAFRTRLYTHRVTTAHTHQLHHSTNSTTHIASPLTSAAHTDHPPPHITQHLSSHNIGSRLRRLFRRLPRVRVHGPFSWPVRHRRRRPLPATLHHRSPRPLRRRIRRLRIRGQVQRHATCGGCERGDGGDGGGRGGGQPA